MAKNCLKCSLPINSEQSLICCKICGNNSVHKECLQSSEAQAQAQFCDVSEQWKCSVCQSNDVKEELTSCDTCSSYVSKLDDLILRINALQAEQNGIVNSIINTYSDTIGEYEESMNGLTSLLSSFQSQLDDFNVEKQMDITDKNKFTETEGGQSSA